MVWVGSGGKDPRRARVRFLFRGEGNLFLPAEPDEPDLSPPAAQVLAFLKSEGACFLCRPGSGDRPVRRRLERGPGRAGHGWPGDQRLAPGAAAGAGLERAEELAPARRPLSSLEAELSAWRKEPRHPFRERAPAPAGRGCSAPSATAARRVERATAPRWPGRWSLVHRIGVWGREVPFEERIARQARQLLQCYGIVTRQSLEGDPEGGWDWRALYPQFQLMEMRGEVRRGYFVQGLPGVQFALPEAVERLRDWTRPDAPADIEEPGARQRLRSGQPLWPGPAGASRRSERTTRPASCASRPTMSCCCAAGRCCCWKPAASG